MYVLHWFGLRYSACLHKDLVCTLVSFAWSRESAQLGNKATCAELFVACSTEKSRNGLAQVHDIIDN